jgi:predicted HTH domain antitoxin
MPSISARIPDEEQDELNEVEEIMGLDRSEIIRKALAEGLHDLRVRTAAERYQSGDVSVNQAARIAGVSLAEWLEIARDRNLTTQLTPTDLEADAEAASDL